jgi:hypothetical protein
MKLLVTILIAAFAATADAVLIPIDIGPPRFLQPYHEFDTYFNSPDLNGRMTFNFRFSDLVRIQPDATTYFVLRFDTNVPHTSSFDFGQMSAVLLDQFGKPIGPTRHIFTIGDGSIINFEGDLIYAGLLYPAIKNRVLDSYGVRFKIDADVDVERAFFRIGAGGRKQVLGDLADTDSTVMLLAIGLSGIFFAINLRKSPLSVAGQSWFSPVGSSYHGLQLTQAVQYSGAEYDIPLCSNNLTN